jgi:putative ABC transport system substrate-binding protein
VRRRDFAALLGTAAVWPFAVAAQEKMSVVGYLTLSAKPTLRDEVFRKGMRALGWVEGKNLKIEERRAGGTERLAAMAQDLVRLKVDVIVALATPAVVAAKSATPTIPIVSLSADPVANRFVASLARPGGNITGLSMMMPQLAGKRLELLKEINPKLDEVAFLLHGKDPSHKIFAREAQEAGQAMGIKLLPYVVEGPGELEGAFALMQKQKADALIVQPLFVNTLGLGPQIMQLALRHKLPTIGDSDIFADVGGMVFYGPDPTPIYERIAYYVDRVLKGAKPAELPIEQPQKFELAINLKTAKALGITIPKSVLVRADRVIE